MVPDQEILAWDSTIRDLARKRCRPVGVEFSDLYQEGYVEVITRYMVGQVPTEQAIINSMRRYLRAIRERRGVIYETIPLQP